MPAEPVNVWSSLQPPPYGYPVLVLALLLVGAAILRFVRRARARERVRLGLQSYE